MNLIPKSIQHHSLFCLITALMLWSTTSIMAVADDIPLRPDTLRTADERFEDLPGYPFAPNYANVDGYRIHFVDQGPQDAAVVLMLHGQPTWSYLYRHMIPIVADAGYRVIAPDLIGFGRSDKPASFGTHSYAFHVDAMTGFIEALDLTNITLVAQDWGSLIGLRVAAENAERFAAIVIANGALPTGTDGTEVGSAFMTWRNSVVAMREAGDMPVGTIMRSAAGQDAHAYDAPFPDATYKAGPLSLPLLVPISADNPATQANQRAWQVLENWQKPFVTAFSDNDPITAGLDSIFQERIPGASGQNHTIIHGGGHFLQETHGQEWAQFIVEFLSGQ